MIHVDHLRFRYSERVAPALDDLTFSVREGESVLVLGPSGCGKSTLALCLDGLIPNLIEGDFSGAATVAGLSTCATPVHELARHVGLVFQDPEAQFCTLTVVDEVAFGLENLLTDPGQIDAKIDDALAMVGLAGFRERRLDTLSGGEKQRVALASVLALGPRILVLDEPSANLDPTGAREIFAVLRDLALTSRHTILIIEHQLDEIVEWIDSVLVLGPTGRPVFHGPPRAAFYDHGKFLDEIGAWRPRASALVDGLRTAGWDVPGQPLSAEEAKAALEHTPGLLPRLRDRPRAVPEPGTPADCAGASTDMSGDVLSVHHLSYGYPGRPHVLEDLSFSFGPGKLIAIAGANGAGKSTLASLLSGVRRPPHGTVILNGQDVRTLEDSVLTAHVGHVFQNPEHQFVSDTVRGELAYSLSHSRRGALSVEDEAAVEAALVRFDLKRLELANPFSLSQGQKRRLSVATMLICAQSVLVLDEPTFGQDRAQSARIMDMLTELWRAGRTIVVVTHDMDLVATYAHKVLVLRDGRLLFFGQPRDFFADAEAVEEAGLDRPALARLSSLLDLHRGRDHRGEDYRPLLTIDDYLAAAGYPLQEPPEDSRGGRAAEMAGTAEMAEMVGTALRTTGDR